MESAPQQNQGPSQEQMAQQTYIQNANSTVINFQEQLRREKMMAAEKVTLKMTNAMNTFNMLQDLRHLIILDFRSEEDYNRSHIRKAVRVDASDYKQKIAMFIVSLHEKTRPGNTLNEVQKKDVDVEDEARKAIKLIQADEKSDGTMFKSHFPNDDLRRVLMIFPEDSNQVKLLETQVNEEIEALSEEILKHSHERLSKCFYLKEFTAFEKKYPLMCVPFPCKSEKQAVTSQSRFPTELKKDKLFLGNLTNVLSKDYIQLKMLGIKTVIHFTPQKFDTLEAQFNCVHFQVEKPDKELLQQLEIKLFVDKIQEIMNDKSKLPAMMFCVNGHLSGAVATRLLMDITPAFMNRRELAMAYITQRRYELKDMPVWLFHMIDADQKQQQ